MPIKGFMLGTCMTVSKKNTKPLFLRKKVWNIAKAYVKSDYKIACKELSNLSPDGLQWLKNVPKEIGPGVILETQVFVIYYIKSLSALIVSI